eukprot:Nk52_evm13s270 gene=Nk52_evmTU13s270
MSNFGGEAVQPIAAEEGDGDPLGILTEVRNHLDEVGGIVKENMVTLLNHIKGEEHMVNRCVFLNALQNTRRDNLAVFIYLQGLAILNLWGYWGLVNKRQDFLKHLLSTMKSLPVYTEAIQKSGHSEENKKSHITFLIKKIWKSEAFDKDLKDLAREVMEAWRQEVNMGNQTFAENEAKNVASRKRKSSEENNGVAAPSSAKVPKKTGKNEMSTRDVGSSSTKGPTKYSIGKIKTKSGSHATKSLQTDSRLKKPLKALSEKEPVEAKKPLKVLSEKEPVEAKKVMGSSSAPNLASLINSKPVRTKPKVETVKRKGLKPDYQLDKKKKAAILIDEVPETKSVSVPKQSLMDEIISNVNPESTEEPLRKKVTKIRFKDKNEVRMYDCQDVTAGSLLDREVEHDYSALKLTDKSKRDMRLGGEMPLAHLHVAYAWSTPPRISRFLPGDDQEDWMNFVQFNTTPEAKRHLEIQKRTTKFPFGKNQMSAKEDTSCLSGEDDYIPTINIPLVPAADDDNGANELRDEDIHRDSREQRYFTTHNYNLYPEETSAQGHRYSAASYLDTHGVSYRNSGNSYDGYGPSYQGVTPSGGASYNRSSYYSPSTSSSVSYGNSTYSGRGAGERSTHSNGGGERAGAKKCWGVCKYYNTENGCHKPVCDFEHVRTSGGSSGGGRYSTSRR